MGKQTLKEQLGSGSKQRKIIPIKSTKQSSWSRRDIFTNISRSSCQTTIFGTKPLWKSWRESPIVDDVLFSHEHEIYPTKSIDENCIELEFQWDRNYYVDLRQSFLALKLKFVKRRGYDTYESKEKVREHKDESVIFTETRTDDHQEEDVARVTSVNNIMHSMFSNVEVYINNQQIYNSNGFYAHKSYVSNNFKPAISEYEGVLHCESNDYEQDLEDISNTLPDPFFTRRMKLLRRFNVVWRNGV